jgi:ABC-type oligopeptide transport system ATPase subunit
MLLSVKSLSISYRTSKGSVLAVDNASLEIQRGSTLALVGESGSGKTTVAKAIVEIVKAQKGSVHISTKSETIRFSSPLWKKNVQMVFQDPDAVFNPKRTIGWHFDEVFSIWHPKLSSEEKVQKQKLLLSAVELDPDILSRYAFELSGGQKQRASILRSLLVEPTFLILDEPLASQDASKRKNLLLLLKKLQKEFSLGYLYITHDLSSLHTFSDSIAVMLQGSIVEIAPTQELLSNPKHPYTQKLLNARMTSIQKELEIRGFKE